MDWLSMVIVTILIRHLSSSLKVSDCSSMLMCFTTHTIAVELRHAKKVYSLGEL